MQSSAARSNVDTRVSIPVPRAIAFACASEQSPTARVLAEKHVNRIGVELHDRVDRELAAAPRTRGRHSLERGLHVLGRGADQTVDLAGDVVGPQLATAGEAVGRADQPVPPRRADEVEQQQIALASVRQQAGSSSDDLLVQAERLYRPRDRHAVDARLVEALGVKLAPGAQSIETWDLTTQKASAGSRPARRGSGPVRTPGYWATLCLSTPVHATSRHKAHARARSHVAKCRSMVGSPRRWSETSQPAQTAV